MLHSIPYNLFDVAQHLFNVFSMPLSSFNIFWGHFEFPQLSLGFQTLPISLQSFLGSAPCLSKVFFVTLTSILQHFPNLFPILPSSPNVHPLFEKNSQCPMMFSWHCLTSSTSPLCYTTPHSIHSQHPLTFSQCCPTSLAFSWHCSTLPLSRMSFQHPTHDLKK